MQSSWTCVCANRWHPLPKGHGWRRDNHHMTVTRPGGTEVGHPHGGGRAGRRALLAHCSCHACLRAQPSAAPSAAPSVRPSYSDPGGDGYSEPGGDGGTECETGGAVDVLMVVPVHFTLLAVRPPPPPPPQLSQFPPLLSTSQAQQAQQAQSRAQVRAEARAQNNKRAHSFQDKLAAEQRVKRDGPSSRETANEADEGGAPPPDARSATPRGGAPNSKGAAQQQQQPDRNADGQVDVADGLIGACTYCVSFVLILQAVTHTVVRYLTVMPCLRGGFNEEGIQKWGRDARVPEERPVNERVLTRTRAKGAGDADPVRV
uniref:Uncharacterized protein n=1 Tax=Prymnesium polylepis TaxID=72548 RepID=A0A7S4HDL3_9EUKA|mmetsp:Transcript_12471/g.31622  ORF Transcript_12471/g.31622 Transcript_12471/m.31622 type:complete len:317 (+) Transcript_12471:439-1389(+)